MSRYADITDWNDVSVRMTEPTLANADALVDADLLNRGISPEEVAAALPIPLLTQLCLAYAGIQASGEQAREGTTVEFKINMYTKQAKDLAAKLTRAALGLPAPTEPGGAYGSVTIGRG